MGWTVKGTVEMVGEGGLEVKPLRSTIDGARDRVSMGRVVAYSGGEGCNELAGVGDVLNPLDFANVETLAFTRIAEPVGGAGGLSEERWEGGDSEEVGWNEPLLLRALVADASAVEVKERCLDKP